MILNIEKLASLQWNGDYEYNEYNEREESYVANDDNLKIEIIKTIAVNVYYYDISFEYKHSSELILTLSIVERDNPVMFELMDKLIKLIEGKHKLKINRDEIKNKIYDLSEYVIETNKNEELDYLIMKHIFFRQKNKELECSLKNNLQDLKICT